MDKIKLGSTNIPLQKDSLTAVYTATDWKKIPVSSIGDVQHGYSQDKKDEKEKILQER